MKGLMMKKLPSEVQGVLAAPYKAPPIKGLLADGSRYRAADDKGGWIVLYFYPKDMTSGCTTEAQDFQASLPAFRQLGARVIGVSRDSCARHVQFLEKAGLTFALIADEEADLCEAFDVWKEKKLYGRSYMGVLRSTFLIDPKGRLVAAWRGVKVPGHVDTVLKTLRSLVSATH